MTQTIQAALDDFIQRYQDWHLRRGQRLRTEWMPDWPSECQVGEPDQAQTIQWQPVRRLDKADFSTTEQALGLEFHPDLKVFFSRYWSDGLNGRTARGALQLLQVWNEQDFERLLQNLIGHALMKRRLEQPMTLFFAVTDDEDYILSLENDTGRVMLERVGLEPQEMLADNLAQFLSSLEPADPAC